MLKIDLDVTRIKTMIKNPMSHLPKHQTCLQSNRSPYARNYYMTTRQLEIPEQIVVNKKNSIAIIIPKIASKLYSPKTSSNQTIFTKFI